MSLTVSPVYDRGVQDNIASVLSEAVIARRDEEEVFAEQLKKYEDLYAALQATFPVQTSLVDTIKVDYISLSLSRWVYSLVFLCRVMPGGE